MAQITVRYFAAAAEAAGREEEPWDLDAADTLESLKGALGERYGEPMRKVLRSGSFLVDGVVRREGAITAVGSEIRGITVDVLPPFAGG
ncbi:MoaD/ThiS family protein [Leucobacter viscericola]|uniref:MoaD/ThiS family protein n=1 Tax=Leucobacter viscericola TaxID=2714935 RepID=A0A6G7XD43_9MICO|nr:MoaD/ThiS family protein [Leucobacter viscericola]QIK62514.1 MoaD/ThiS family protein [Leucobacter viscericola]